MGMSLVVSYSFIAISAIVARANGATRHGHYRMPLWPVAPILAAIALIYVAKEQPLNLLVITGGEMAVGLLWWAAVVLPERGKAWTLKQAALDVNESDAEMLEIVSADPEQ
jgi:hypothetical protein